MSPSAHRHLRRSSTSLSAAAGTPDHSSGGDPPAPSQVNSRGITAPSANAALLIAIVSRPGSSGSGSPCQQPAQAIARTAATTIAAPIRPPIARLAVRRPFIFRLPGWVLRSHHAQRMLSDIYERRSSSVSLMNMVRTGWGSRKAGGDFFGVSTSVASRGPRVRDTGETAMTKRVLIVAAPVGDPPRRRGRASRGPAPRRRPMIRRCTSRCGRRAARWRGRAAGGRCKTSTS